MMMAIVMGRAKAKATGQQGEGESCPHNQAAKTTMMTVHDGGEGERCPHNKAAKATMTTVHDGREGEGDDDDGPGLI